jgi:hypothetical protein
MDGMILFDNLSDFLGVKNAVYKDVMDNFKPKIDKFAQKVGLAYFNKFCFFTYRMKYKDDKEKQLGKIYTLITMCLDKQTTNASLDKFSRDFKSNMSEFVFKEPQYGKVQNYRFKQNIEIQYYDPLAKIDHENPEVPDFYTSFTPEGLVLNKDKNYDPTKVKFSFRFDQLVDCIPREAATLKAIISPKLAALYKPDDCCVSYLVDWQMKGVKNMFCSMYDKMFKCKTDIKVFQSTLYEYCIAGKIDVFKKLMKKNNQDLKKAKLYFLEQAGIINFLNEIITKNLEKYQNPESKLYADIVKLKKDAKTLRKTALKLFEKDVNKTPGKTTPSCKDILKGALERQEKPEGENSDFEKTDRQQQKSDKSNPAQALTMINKYKMQYCQELKDLQINEDPKKKGEDEKEEKKPENKPEDKKKPDSIKDKLNDIKKMAMDTLNHCKKKEKLTPNEALKMTNVILKNHKIFETIHKQNKNISKKICKELKTDPAAAIASLNKLANEKKDKFTFDKPVLPALPPKKDGNPLDRKEDEKTVNATKIWVNFNFY